MEILPFSHINDRIAIPCAKCDEYVLIGNLQLHREMHHVWKILRCNSETAPKTMKQLLKKRRQIINSSMMKLESGSPLPAKVLQKIDWAFEIVRKAIADNGDLVDDVTISKYTTFSDMKPDGKNKSSNVVVEGAAEKLQYVGQSVGVCHCHNSKWRITDEDRHIYKESSLSDFEQGFFGLFDGYNGVTAAEKCSKFFYGFLRDELMASSNMLNPDQMSNEDLKHREDFVKQAIRKSFLKMDSYLLTGEFESSKFRWSGTSATVCYIENDTLYVANSGNVRALFVKGDGSAISLVEDHTPNNKKERDRIRKANGALSFSPRSSMVNGLISSTRGLGNHGDPGLKSAVISSPNITVSKIDPNDQFLVLYTAGISDVFSDEEVMFLLEDIMPDTTEIENLREHFAKKSHVIGTEVNCQDSKVNELDIAKSEEILSVDDQPFDYDMSKEDTDIQRKVSITSDLNDDKIKSISFDENAERLDVSQRKGRLPNETKPCFLARALVERLVYSAVLANTRENTTAMVVLLHGCPINLYLLPNVKRKSLFIRELPKYERNNEPDEVSQN